MKQMAPAMKNTADCKPSIGSKAARKPVTRRAEILSVVRRIFYWRTSDFILKFIIGGKINTMEHNLKNK